VAAENIDNTVNGTGLFPTKVPGLSDAADIQAALRLYHYGSYAYDGANVNPANLVNPSIAKHLQNLVDADATHSAKTTDVHGIANTANLATKAYVDTAVTNGINGATSAYSDLAGNGIDWNSVDLRFDLDPALANTGTVITKTESFTLSAEDIGKTILLSTSTPNTLTLPKNSSVQIPVGYSVDIIQIGTALTTITEEDSSVFLNSKSNVRSLDGQYSKGTLSKIGSDTWFFFGNLLNIVSPTPTPTAPTPTAPTPTPPAPTPTPPAPTPTPPAPTPTPPAPTPTPPAPTPTPPAPTPTPTLPTLPTPTLTYTTGWNVYPSSVYANVTITNHDYSNSYSSSLGTQNQEFPEEFNISGLTPNQSYTVYITASRAGYQSSTGSITFAATPGASPTPTPAPTPTPTSGPIYITYAYCDSSGYINGYSGMDISYGGYTSVNEACTGIGNSLSQNGATNFTCVQGTASSPLYTSLGVSCINDPAPTPTPTPGTYNIYTYCDPVIVGSRGGAYGTATASSTVVVGTTTNPSLTSEQIVALLGYGGGCPSVPVVNPGTVYLAYCLDGQPYSESYTVDANNVLTTNINEACSVYTNLLSGIGATKIDCSIVSARPAPTGCSSTPTPTPPAPTPTPPAPTPTPPANCTLPNVVGMTESAAGNAIVASGWLFEYLDYTTVGATQQNNGTVASQSPAGGTTDICGLNAGITVYQYSQTPTPTAPTPTAPTPTQTFYYAYGCCNGLPEVIDGPNSNTARAEYQSATGCTESGVTTNYQTALANAQSLCGSTPTPTAPTPTAPTPTVDCNTCNTYSPYADGSYATRPNSGCPSGSEYYRTCVTPGSCPNIDQTNGCVPTTPTPTAPTPTAVTAQWKCTESYQCGGTGNCSYTTPGYDNSGSGTGYSRQCIYTTGDFPACQSTNCSPTPTAPTPTAPTPTADCNTCVSYGGACGTYGNGTWCITPGSCPNICQGDYAPTPTPPAPTPTPPASSNRTCSQSDYANLPSPYCMYPGACDPLGSLSSC
jgi:hypothetical protein